MTFLVLPRPRRALSLQRRLRKRGCHIGFDLSQQSGNGLLGQPQLGQQLYPRLGVLGRCLVGLQINLAVQTRRRPAPAARGRRRSRPIRARRVFPTRAVPRPTRAEPAVPRQCVLPHGPQPGPKSPGIPRHRDGALVAHRAEGTGASGCAYPGPPCLSVPDYAFAGVTGLHPRRSAGICGARGTVPDGYGAGGGGGGIPGTGGLNVGCPAI